MDNQEMRKLKAELGLSDYKINYKTGVHLGEIEGFFAGKIEALDIRDRLKIEALLEAEAKKR